MDPTYTKDIVVIGGSTGSGRVLKSLVAGLPADFPASVFISTHVAATSPSLLSHTLAARANLPVTQAVDGQPIETSTIYIVTPDRHLLLMGDTIRLGSGPKENMARPAVDPMFRSAAMCYGPRVIGAVLTGMLNDGAAGLHAIHACGGTTIVQHPVDAEADQMPLAALHAVDVDYVTTENEIANLLVHLAGSKASSMYTPPSDALRLEVDIAAGARLGSRALLEIATPTPITCPACHGVLSEVRDTRPLRFRCQIGHAYTAEALAGLVTEIDEAIRVAMRVMEERVTLVERMARDAREAGRAAVAELYDERAVEYRRYASTLREAAITSLRSSSARQQEV